MHRPLSDDQALAQALELHRGGKLGPAIRAYEKIVRRAPQNAAAQRMLGIACFQDGQLERAATALSRALELDPSLPDAHYNLGIVLHKLGRYEEAVQHHERAAAARPDDAEALLSLGGALKELGRYEKAVERYRQALAIKGDYAEVHCNLGGALVALERFEESVQHFQKALALKPVFPEAHMGLGNALQRLDRPVEALFHHERAVALKPDDVEAHNGLGVSLKELNRHEQAVAQFRKVLALEPGHKHAFSNLAQVLLHVCDWSDFLQVKGEFERRIRSAEPGNSPFVFMHYSGDPALQLQCAKIRMQTRNFDEPLPPIQQRRCHNRLRIAYLSADFLRSSSAQLFSELFELHDRTDFEVIGISFGKDDKSEIRSRLIKSFDRFLDVRGKSDRETAALMRELEIDIAVDLKGHTQDSRLEILALRPAPVQVTYLGFQGTTGTDFIDYILGDRIALPFELQPYFTEKIVHLPGCHQVTDTKMQVPSEGPTRREAGLPEDAFVYCSFNNNNKINPQMFDVWMRLLQQVDNSVLWMTADHETTRRYLRTEAASRGVDPARLVWGETADIGAHLARHRLADLYLDTLPVNAHTSASRTLWAGLPILTCQGGAFAGRVTASLLHAIGLPELVTASLEEYESLAVKLARERPLLERIQRRLAENRKTYSLFDMERFARNLERAYRIMWERWKRGEAPTNLAVETE